MRGKTILIVVKEYCVLVSLKEILNVYNSLRNLIKNDQVHEYSLVG